MYDVFMSERFSHNTMKRVKDPSDGGIKRLWDDCLNSEMEKLSVESDKVVLSVLELIQYIEMIFHMRHK